MTYVYDFEVFKYDWLVLFKELDKDSYTIIHNDVKKLKEFILQVDSLIGFNNYFYDDLILFTLLKTNASNEDIYNLSKKIINEENIIWRYKISKHLKTYDCIQELQAGTSLKQIECNLGMNIKESTISFDIKRPLTSYEIKETIEYCRHDVIATEKVYKLRLDYFTAKKEIVEEFKLEPMLFKKTRASLTAEVLKANQKNVPIENDRLNINLIDKIDLSNLPKELVSFYENIRNEYLKDNSIYSELEKKHLALDISNVPHKFGFGGAHGAKKAFIFKGNILYLDFSSFYPSLMIKYNFLSRACENKEDYKMLYDTRFSLKANKNPKEYIYKILLNATYGATKDPYSKMFDPLQANNICINGQLILIDLVLKMSKYAKLIQSNTDGIMMSYEEENLHHLLQIKTDFEKQYDLLLGFKKLKAIYQRDVNNYLIVDEFDKVSGTGLFKVWNENKTNFESYSLPIIGIALKKYYIDGIPIEDTINNLIDNKILIPFQLVAKKTNKFDYLAYRFNNEYIKLDTKVNRIFASKNTSTGMLYKVRNGKYDKYANTPNHILIHNDSIETLNTDLLDKNYYIRLCKNMLIENQKVKKVNMNTDFKQLSLFDLS